MFLRKKDKFVSLVLRHLGTSALMDLLLRLVSCVEPVGLRQEVLHVSVALSAPSPVRGCVGGAGMGGQLQWRGPGPRAPALHPMVLSLGVIRSLSRQDLDPAPSPLS